MKFIKIGKYLKNFANLQFAIWILVVIIGVGAFGSLIEQEESVSYYQENYPSNKPIYGFITWRLILNLGIDHIFQTWWFLFLLAIFGSSLSSCTFIRQFPTFLNSKQLLFKKGAKFFWDLPFFIQNKTLFYLKEMLIARTHKLNFYIFQKRNLSYAYKGIIGRISPILVHFSIIIILFGACMGALKSFKDQEVLPKGEFFHIQNTTNVSSYSFFQKEALRVNDFWGEYEKRQVRQFYSSLSLIDSYGNEIKEQTISVNNPLKLNKIDFYQGDWDLLGLRVTNTKANSIYELPLFSLKKNSKISISLIQILEKNYALIVDKLQSNFLVYDQNGIFLSISGNGEYINENILVLEILPSTGLLIKYDPSITAIYLGFALLMLTTYFSYFAYTQLWMLSQTEKIWLGGLTNRSKIQLEVQIESLVRSIKNFYAKKFKKQNFIQYY